MEERKYPDGYLEELNEAKAEYQRQYRQIEEIYDDGFKGRDDRASVEIGKLTQTFRTEIERIRRKYSIN